MDWPKAKTILIIAFLITDLILIAVYWTPGNNIDEFGDNETLIAVLERNNVYLETDIPQEHSDMPVLYVQHEFHDEKKIEALLAKQKIVTGRADGGEEYKKAAEQFIKDAGITYDTLIFDKIEEAGDDTIVSFANQINEIPIEKSSIICTFEDRLLTKFEYNWLHAEGSNNKKQSTISAVDALLAFMDNENGDENKKLVIEEIKMVYWLDESGIDVDVVADTAIPAWKIVYNGGKTQYVNAYEQ